MTCHVCTFDGKNPEAMDKHITKYHWTHATTTFYKTVCWHIILNQYIIIKKVVVTDKVISLFWTAEQITGDTYLW